MIPALSTPEGGNNNDKPVDVGMPCKFVAVSLAQETGRKTRTLVYSHSCKTYMALILWKQ